MRKSVCSQCRTLLGDSVLRRQIDCAFRATLTRSTRWNPCAVRWGTQRLQDCRHHSMWQQTRVKRRRNLSRSSEQPEISTLRFPTRVRIPFTSHKLPSASARQAFASTLIVSSKAPCGVKTWQADSVRSIETVHDMLSSSYLSTMRRSTGPSMNDVTLPVA